MPQKQVILIKNTIILICLVAGINSYTQKNISKKAKNYLKAYVEIVQENALHRDLIDWRAFSDSLYKHAASAQTEADCYAAINKTLPLLNDGHSFLMTAEQTAEWKQPSPKNQKDTIPGPVPKGFLMDSVAYIDLPWFHSGNERSCQLFADTLQSVVQKLDANKVKGWVIDLRDNLGGNNWPMHAGISALYQDSIVGSYTFPNGNKDLWVIKNNGLYDHDTLVGKTSTPYLLKNRDLPIAILVNQSTASSGETVLVSFLGSKRVRTFGTPSHGSTTANELYPLSDGAQLLLTVAWYADRNGTIYKAPIKPNETFTDGKACLKRAIEWIQNFQ